MKIIRYRTLLEFLKKGKQSHRVLCFTYFCNFVQVVSYYWLGYSLKFFINTVIPKKEIAGCLWFLFAWITLYLVHGVFTLVSDRFKIHIVKDLIAEIRTDVINKLKILQIRYYDENGPGKVSNRILMDMEKLHLLLDWFIAKLPTAVFGVVLIIPFLYELDGTLAVVTMVYIPMVIAIQHLLKKRMLRLSGKFRASYENLSHRVVEFISGIRHLRLAAVENEQNKKIHSSILDLRESDKSYTFTARQLSVGIQFAGEIIPILLWVFAGMLMAKNKDISIGAVVAFVAVIKNLINQMNSLFQFFEQAVAASPSLTAVHELLSCDDVEPHNLGRKDFELKGTVRVENLTFSYPARRMQKQLVNASLSIRPGEHVAFVGESGAGKSTIIEVILGLHDYSQGEIWFDDLNLKDLNLKKLRSQVSILTQETFLFNASIYENFTSVKPDATEKDIREACRKAEILDFIESLPESFATIVGERGVMLSGGQRQRIGIARAFLRNTSILIMDEPCSALDVLTEKRIVNTLFRNLRNTTVITVTHRVSTVAEADKIFVFKDGRVIESGNFSSLMQEKSHFREMVKESAPPALANALSAC